MPGDAFEIQRIAGRIGATAQLQAITLRELRWTMPEINIPPGLPIDLRPEFEAQGTVNPGIVAYKIRTVVSGVIPDEIEIFQFCVEYHAVFTLPEGLEITQQEVEAFGSMSVMMMLFPYVREALQSTAARAGMPGVTLQPIRAPFAASEELAGADA
jgi:preprotein translocase subunit SecB